MQIPRRDTLYKYFFVYMCISMHTYIFTYVDICIASTYGHICRQACDERGRDGIGDGGVGTFCFFSRGSDDVKADEGVETRRGPFEHLRGGPSVSAPGRPQAPNKGEGTEQKGRSPVLLCLSQRVSGADQISWVFPSGNRPRGHP